MKQQSLLGIFWIILSMLAFSSTVSIAKFLDTQMPTVVKVFMRLFFGLMLLLPFMYNNIKTFKTKQGPLYLLRAILVCLSMLCTYYTYAHLPLTIATSIGFTTPIITTTLSILFLKEKVNAIRWLIVIVGYIGVLIILRASPITFNLAALVGFLGNFLASCAIIVANKISRTDTSKQILFITNILSFMLLIGPAFYFWQTPSQSEIVFLCLLGGTGVLSQYCYLQAISYEKVSFLAPFEYMRLIFSVPIGFLIFNEIPHSYAILGSVIIIFSNLMLVYKDAKH